MKKINTGCPPDLSLDEFIKLRESTTDGGADVRVVIGSGFTDYHVVAGLVSRGLIEPRRPHAKGPLRYFATKLGRAKVIAAALSSTL